MIIGIDISQIAHEETGVANYTKNLVSQLVKVDDHNEYILFFSSLRKKLGDSLVEYLKNPRVKLKTYRIPPTLLELLWNRWHILPIEYFIGEVDVFFTSDWLEPPAKKAKKVTTIHDLIVFKHPEGLVSKIVTVQKRKLNWVKKESKLVICDSQATKKDVLEILGIEENKLKIIYPGGIGKV